MRPCRRRAGQQTTATIGNLDDLDDDASGGDSFDILDDLDRDDRERREERESGGIGGDRLDDDDDDGDDDGDDSGESGDRSTVRVVEEGGGTASTTRHASAPDDRPIMPPDLDGPQLPEMHPTRANPDPTGGELEVARVRPIASRKPP